MNILFLIPELGYGGAETAILRLAKALSAKHRVQMAVFSERYAQKAYAHHIAVGGFLVHRLDPLSQRAQLGRWLTRRRNLIAIKKREKIDVTISFLTGPNFLNVISRYHDRIIVSFRGSRRFDAHAGGAKRRLYSLSDQIVCRLADKVVSVSRGLSAEIAKMTGQAESPKFFTIPPGVDSSEMIAVASSTIEPEFETLAAAPTIVSFGRHSIEKGFDRLIHVFANLKVKHKDAKLLLIGDGPVHEQLKDLATDLGMRVSDRPSLDVDIIMPGFRKDPARYLRLGRLFVLPSRNEGFGNVLLEALAAGRPIMAADVPWGPRDLFERPSSEVLTPYPREAPLETNLGWLMPQIDKLEYQNFWLATLSRALSENFDPTFGTENRFARLKEYDQEKIASRWECLLNPNEV